MTARRPILVAALGLAALAGWRVAVTVEPGVVAALRRAVGPDASARAVGRAYLAAHPAEADRERLVRTLVAEPATARALLATRPDPAALGEALAQAIRGDFLARRMVKVDGWLLARTEARLCALACLA